MSAWAIRIPGAVDFAATQAWQQALVEARLRDELPDLVLFLEHRPVITLGCRGRDNYLLATKDLLASRGIALERATRGGDVTYHGPGQLVMYPILKLGSREADAHGYLHNLEEIALRTAASFGVEAYRRQGMNGAWCAAGKLAAIGFRLRRWVAYHGMSFNVDPDLEGFRLIVPCGLEGEPVTSLARILGSKAPHLETVARCMGEHFEAVCGRPWSTSRSAAYFLLPSKQLAMRPGPRPSLGRDPGSAYWQKVQVSGPVRDVTTVDPDEEEAGLDPNPLAGYR